MTSSGAKTETRVSVYNVKVSNSEVINRCIFTSDTLMILSSWHVSYIANMVVIKEFRLFWGEGSDDV